MPTLKFDPKTGKVAVQGNITSVNINATGSVGTTQTENNGVTTSTITYQNGGYVTSTPNGTGFQISAKDVLLTYSDDPNSAGDVILNIKMDESV